MNFDANLSFGKIGEGYIANWLKSKGWCVLPVYEKEINEGKGPQIFTQNISLIAPDLFVFKLQNSEALFVEAKTKSAFTWYRNTNCWVTGIDLRHYEHYLQVQKLSPFPVWLLFLHLNGIAKDTPDGYHSPTGLFGGELSYLERNEHHRSDKWARGMVYWEYKILKQITTLDEFSKGAIT